MADRKAVKRAEKTDAKSVVYWVSERVVRSDLWKVVGLAYSTVVWMVVWKDDEKAAKKAVVLVAVKVAA